MKFISINEDKIMNFIKKVFDGEVGEDVHLQFQKYSKGEFRNRALVRIKSSGKKYTIYTSAEFANDLVRIMAEKLGEEKTMVTGAIVSTNDLTRQLEFKGKKQFQGVKRYIIENEMSGDEIIELLDKLPKAFFALSFEAGEHRSVYPKLQNDRAKLKIKPKAPKSSKSKNKEAPKPDFCKLVTKDKDIVNSFVFEDSDFKEANINHTFMIDEIIIPEEIKQEKDFAKIREMAKRKGKVIRNVVIDEQVFKEEK
ncbi:hypothetical protein KAT24_02970, partial [Candidatus Pacearchaeota archaeon]|nr:hypothetical protein [Candidatus Pacearchaeota archaeon]